jgi:hypothetical protein
MDSNNNKMQISITKLPSELIFEITKHLRPVDYISLYKTNKALKDVLSYKPEYNKNMIRYLKNKFIYLSIDYLTFKDISVFDFDYFAENNDVGYDGKTESFKKLYEQYMRGHLHRDFKFNLNTYITCLSANESFSGLSLNVKYDRNFALKFSDFACYNDENITDEAKERLRKTAISVYLNRLYTYHEFKVMDNIDRFLYRRYGYGLVYNVKRRIRFTEKAIQYGRYAISNYNALKDIKNIAIYLFGIAWKINSSIEANYQEFRAIFDKLMARRKTQNNKERRKSKRKNKELTNEEIDLLLDEFI